MGSTIFSHFPASGGGSFIGNEDEIVTYDGEDWVKQSGIYTTSRKVSFFESFPTQWVWSNGQGTSYYDNYLQIKNTEYTSTMTINNLIITDITEETPFVVYNMQEDPDFELLSDNTHSMLYAYNSYGTYEVTTDPQNSITLSVMSTNSPNLRYLAIKGSVFDEQRLYRIEATVDSNYCQLARDSTVLKGAVSNLITYETPAVFRVEDRLDAIKTDISSQLLITGNKDAKTSTELNNTYFLAMSDTTRHTMHDNAKFDMTHNSELYMHDGSKIHADGGNAYLHGGQLTLNGDPTVVFQGDSTGSPAFYMNGKSYFTMNGNEYGGNADWDPFIAASGNQFMFNGNQMNFDMGTPEEPSLWPMLSIENAVKVLLGGNGGKTWVKIGTNNGNVQVHILNNSFFQMTGNSHSEIHDNSVVMMKGKIPVENVTLTRAARLQYEEANLASATVSYANGTSNSNRAKISLSSNGRIFNKSVSDLKPAFYDEAGTRVAGVDTWGTILDYAATADTNYYIGSYEASPSVKSYKIYSTVPFTLIKQGDSETEVNAFYDLPEGGTGIAWDDLSAAERYEWYRASYVSPKVEGSPCLEMSDNAYVYLKNDITIKGDGDTLCVNDKRLVSGVGVSELCTMTQAEYDSIESPSPGVLYIIVEDE